MNSLKQTEDSGTTFAMLHPAVQIYVWICMLLLVQIVHEGVLLALAGVLIAFAFAFFTARFLTLVRRTRWILFSLFFIYAYTGSGEALWPELAVFSPVAEGLVTGGLQVLRLLTILASLSILLTALSRAQLVTGIYTLLYPFAYVGLPRERLAVRLALTLHYAEHAMLKLNMKWQQTFEQLLISAESQAGEVELNVVRLSYFDWLLVATSTAVIFGLII
jgi:energy-coupling factor transporter transmembrane protein EcfT